MAKKHSNSYKSHESTQNAPEQHSGKVKNVVADTKNDVRLTIQDDETSHEKQPSAPLASQQEDTAKLIAAHKAALVAEEEQAVAPHSASTAEVKSVKKKGKIDRNPLNWVRHIGTRALSGIVGLPSRVAAKLNHIVARPQQLVSGKFYTDLGKNALKVIPNMITTVTGAIYRPHRDKFKLEDNFQDYGPTFGPDATDKNGLVRGGKKALWLAGKAAAPATGGLSLLPKFFSNLSRGLNHVIHETFEGVRDSKWHWNPKNWNLKPWKFSKTKEAFGKAFSWNKKGKSPKKAETKVVDISAKEHQKAA